MNSIHKTPLYLVFHTTYHAIIIGLYQGEQCLGTVHELKKNSSKNILLLMDDLLTAHSVTLRDCTFIGAHNGPGPFTTVRVTIASVNGLAFATQLPLVGVNGLYALLDEYSSTTPCTIAILNAYCGDLYYAIQKDGVHEMGTSPLHEILKNPLIHNTPTTWIGNGVLLHKDTIQELPNAYVPNILPEICSIEFVARHALTAFKANNITNQLIPLYIKSGSAIMGKLIVLQ